MKIGIYSGSFNPIHKGHTALADYLLKHTDLDEIHLLVSPHNPLKEKDNLLDDELRLQMAKLVVEDFRYLKVSEVEFALPKPSYTIQTLKYLTEKYPDDEFVLIIGADNLDVFHLWKDYREILDCYRVIVYPRKGYCASELCQKYPQVEYIDAPLFDISSSEVREKTKNDEDISPFLHPKVGAFIKEKKLY